jgi:uncharacterized protein
LIIQVRVKPNARVSALEQKGDGTWLAQLKASPVDGKANAVSIKSGARGRTKLIKIESR